MSKVKITINAEGKKTKGEAKVRDSGHFEAQLKNPSKVYVNQKAYKRRTKHRNQMFKGK